MNNRSGGPRSFYTVKRSNREDRLRRRMQGRITLLAICTTLLLLAVSGLVLFICDLAHNAPLWGDRTPTGDTEVAFQIATVASSQYREGDLIVVNSSHVYSFPAQRLESMSADAKLPYSLAQYRTKPDGANYPYSLNLAKEQLLLPQAAQALNLMLAQYYTIAGDAQIAVYDTYRSDKDQQNTGSSVAAGYSEHHTALVVSLKVLAGSTYSDLSEAERPWLFQNCHAYGFIQRYPASKSGITGVSNYTECFRYVGVPHATYIEQNNLCLEEYVNLLKNNQ